MQPAVMTGYGSRSDIWALHPLGPYLKNDVPVYVCASYADEAHLMLSGLMDLAKAFLQAFHSVSLVERYVKRLSCPYGLNSCIGQDLVGHK